VVKQQTIRIDRTNIRDEENRHQAFTYETQAVIRRNSREKERERRQLFKERKHPNNQSIVKNEYEGKKAINFYLAYINKV
jgi:hypothetical protein